MSSDGACNVKNEIERTVEHFPPSPPSLNLYIDTYILGIYKDKINSGDKTSERGLLLLPTNKKHYKQGNASGVRLKNNLKL